MLIGNNIDTINKQIELLKHNYKLIMLYERAAYQSKLLYKSGQNFKEIDIQEVINTTNHFLNDLNIEPIKSIDSLDNLLLSLQIRFMTTDNMIQNHDEEYFNSIKNLEENIEKLSDISNNIKYYSGIDNCKNLLIWILNRARNNGQILLDYNTGLIKDLIEFKSELSFELDPEIYKNVAKEIDDIVFYGKSNYSVQEEEKIIMDLKRAVGKVLNPRRQTNLAVKIIALENKHRSNIIGLRQVNSAIGADIGNRPLNIKSLINVIHDENDKNALVNMASKYNWGIRNDLTLNEIIDSINEECKGKDKYIGSTLSNQILLQIEMKQKQLNILKSQDKHEVLTKLSKQQDKLYESINVISGYVSIKNQNKDILRNAKIESDNIIRSLDQYNVFLIENICDEVRRKMEQLDSYVFDSKKFKEIVSSQNTSEDMNEKMSEKERFKIFSKYYLEQSNNIYIEAVRAYCLMPTKIDYIINRFNYRKKPLDYNSSITQFMNDLDDFFDKLSFSADKKTREILDSQKLSKRVIAKESPSKKLININNLNPKFNLQRSFDNLKLYRQYLSKKILNMVTNITLGTDDLGEYGRSQNQLMNDSDELADYINSRSEIPEIFNVGQSKK